MSDADQYYQATKMTADDLRTIARSLAIDEFTRLALPEVDEVVDVVSRVVPAGNVPALILSGLSRLNGRKAQSNVVKRDVNMLLKGVETVLDKAVFGTFFAGPAAVIWGYQNLLKLAGKDPNDSFPEGTWQFYVEYALREDTARHANETNGFDSTLSRLGIKLSKVDRITAWVMTAIQTLADYDSLLENEWRERVYADLLKKAAPNTDFYDDIYETWQKRIPYGKRSDSKEAETYATYRRRKFDEYFEPIMRKSPPDVMRNWLEAVRDTKIRDLLNYLNQMTMLAYLDAGVYSEVRTPVDLSNAHIGVIHRGMYYFLPVCHPGTKETTDVQTVRQWVAAILKTRDVSPAELSLLCNIKRSSLPGVITNLSPESRAEINLLRTAPILFNTDIRPQYLPLAEIRHTERGIGDHPLTLFDTGETIVFDQSHIFFDGAWGAALAEIMTNEAIAWGAYLNSLDEAQPAAKIPHSSEFQFSERDRKIIRNAPTIIPEVSAESDSVNLERLVNLRKAFKQRSQEIKLTVNDILLLYRAIHGYTYAPSKNLLDELHRVAEKAETSTAVKAALHAIEESYQTNPTILMPVDASQTNPRDRLYPISFEVPLADLDLMGLHHQALQMLDNYTATMDNHMYDTFRKKQRVYLATLAGFGEVMVRAKHVAMSGESASVGTIKLLAHMPMPLRRLLDKIPSRFDVLNDIIKGREVFSNIGQVAPNSSLSRFITAKDDNDKKTLAWGVITDNDGVMHVSLRDFRPHVGMLIHAGYRDLATRITQDYVDSYTAGINRYVQELWRITVASKEKRLTNPGW